MPIDLRLGSELRPSVFSSTGRSGWWRRLSICVVISLNMHLVGCNSSNNDQANDDQANNQSPPVDEGEKTSPTIQSDLSQSPAVSLGRIRNVAQSGRFKEAYRLAQSYLVANPNDPEAIVIAGECLAALGNRDDAIDVFLMVAPANAEFGVRALGQAADLQVAAERPEEALATYGRIVEHHDDVTLAHRRMAWILNSMGRRFEAAKHLRVLAGRREITWRQLSGLVSICDQNSVQPIPGTTGDETKLVAGDLRRARQLAMTRKWDECVALTNRLVEKFPESAPIAAYAGTVYADRQDVGSLVQWRKNLPKGIENHPEYWSAIAQWSAMEGDLKGAVRAAMESIELDQTNYLMFLKLGQWLQATGNTSGAQNALERSRHLVIARDVMRSFFTGEPTAAAFVQMANSMIKLKRPNEAIGWAVQAQKAGIGKSKLRAIEEALLALQNDPAAEGNAARQTWVFCGVSKDEYPMPKVHTDQLVPAPKSRDDDASNVVISFQDITEKVASKFAYDPGFDSDDGSYFLHQMMGGGIGVIDFDLDGWQDVYFSQGGGHAFSNDGLPNQLLRNLDGLSSSDSTAASGSDDRNDGRGVTVADVNQDGFPDLIVANIGPNVCFQNNGDGTFRRREFEFWKSEDRWTSSVAVADVTGDGLPELFECNYIDDPKSMSIRCTKTEQNCAPREFLPSRNRILTISPDGAFIQLSDSMGFDQHASYSLGVMVTNVDGRFGNDVFVANDTLENTLWVSTQLGESSPQRYGIWEAGRVSGTATGPVGENLGCMGIAVGDFDRDGSFDMHITNYYNESSNLYLQKSTGLFSDNAARYDLRDPTTLMVGFGTHANDLDRDGYLDMIVLNGHAVDRRSKGEPLEMPPQVFRGANGAFSDAKVIGEFWSRPTIGRSLAIVDWDRDGRVDFWANHIGDKTNLLKNTSKSGNWLRLAIIGTESERDAIGARITVFAGDQSWTSWVTGGDGYFCTNEMLVDIGVADAKAIEKVVVDWPAGETKIYRDLDVNRVYLIVEGQSHPFQY